MKFTTLAIAGGAMALWAGAAHADAPTCASLTALKLPHAVVTAAVDAPAGGATACKVNITAKPTADSDIRIELWIPEGAAWNGRFVQYGNGGFAGQIISARLQGGAGLGYAVAMTDDGHQTALGTDGRWAIGHPEKVVDFGWRALKETTDASKAVIRAYEGAPAKYAYFQGCSDGGREALMEAQRFPDDFNGIIAGAPAYNFSRLLTLAAANVQALSKPDGYLTPENLKTLEAGALTACAHGGRYIVDQAACRFDPASVACAPGQASGCLTAGEVATARAIYRGVGGAGGAYAGNSPGAEAEPQAWEAWITGSSAQALNQARSPSFAAGFWGGFIHGDASYDVTKLDLATASKAAAEVAKAVDSTDPDLAKFRPTAAS